MGDEWMVMGLAVCRPERFEDIREGTQRAFPSGRASMQHFDQFLGVKLMDVGLRKAVRQLGEEVETLVGDADLAW